VRTRKVLKNIFKRRNICASVKLVPSSSDLPELGKDCYYLVLDGARRDILLSRAKPTDRILTLREFCEKGLARYSEKPVISRARALPCQTYARDLFQ